MDREILSEIKNNLDNDLILLIIGARQVGKTSIIKKIYNELNINKTFLNLEDFEYLRLLNEHPENIFKLTKYNSQTKQIIFIDEIQYLNNPTNFLKYIYDEYKGIIKIVATGSSSFYIDEKFKDSLVGRKKIFNIFTLNFREFLNFKDKSDLLNRDNYSIAETRLIKELFSEYITYGGYPAVVLENDIENKKEKLMSIAYDYVKKDVYEADIKYTEQYYNILKIIANEVGNLINKSELSKSLKISLSSVEKCFYVMQKSFHIALIKPYFKNVRKELTKMPKGYFLDLGLRNLFCNNYNNIELREDKGMLLENVVFREMAMQLKYFDFYLKFWRTQDQNEVDFIINEKQAIEVKFSKDNFNIKKYSKFIENYPDIKLECIDYDDIIKMSLNKNFFHYTGKTY